MAQPNVVAYIRYKEILEAHDISIAEFCKRTGRARANLRRFNNPKNLLTDSIAKLAVELSEVTGTVYGPDDVLEWVTE